MHLPEEFFFAFPFVFRLITFAFGENKDPGVVELSLQNFDEVAKKSELVFLNFYVNWCPYSVQLSPLFEESAKQIYQEYKVPEQVVYARMDCEAHREACSKFQISKYPTLKFLLNGRVMKQEYRGQRSPQALSDYVRDLLKNPVIMVRNNISEVDLEKPAVIAFFRKPPYETPTFNTFRKVAIDLRDHCNFYWVYGEASKYRVPPGKKEFILFKQQKAPLTEDNIDFTGEMGIYDDLRTWALSMCIPVVREITFDNAEEITEEGLPLVILFHKHEDEESVDWFKLVVHYELIKETANFNFITANGEKFNHPLAHLGKSTKDLPLIAIDSFRHMYLFPSFEDIKKGHVLQKFLDDYTSGKLHHELHSPKKTTTTTTKAKDGDEDDDDEDDNEKATTESKVLFTTEEPTTQTVGDGVAVIKRSVFKKLQPQSSRYTLLRDEL